VEMSHVSCLKLLNEFELNLVLMIHIKFCQVNFNSVSYRGQGPVWAVAPLHHRSSITRTLPNPWCMNTPASYSGSYGMKSRPGYLLDWPTGFFFCGFPQYLHASAKTINLNWAETASFYVFINLLFIRHPIIRRYIILAVISIVK
jgi:hypothetical protein